MLTSSHSSPSLHATSPRCSSTPSRAPRNLSSTTSSSAASPSVTASAALSASSTSLRKIAFSPPAATSQPASVLVSSTTAQPQLQHPRSVDVGTQYSPPDWPPTSSRSSLWPARAVRPAPSSVTTSTQAISNPGVQQIPEAPPPPAQKVASQDGVSVGDRDSVPPAPPAEPTLRVTPPATFQNAIRRPLSADSSTDTSAVTSSSADSKKRARHGDSAATNLQVLPADYSLCPAKTLASVIASMLMRLIAHNDSIPLKDGHLTRFHSRAPPGISVHDYLARLTFHGTLSPPILLSMVFFIDRLSSNYPKFIINSLTVHRFLITAATAASKGLSDSFWTNHVYARVGGVTVKELALLELELLMQCDWKIVPKQEDLIEYYRGLVRQSDEYVLEGDKRNATDSRENGTTPEIPEVGKAAVVGEGSASSDRHASGQSDEAKDSRIPGQDDPMDLSGGNG